MFKHEGPARSPRKNALLAAYLACVAGFVNSGGFVIIASFTSHVTGNLGRLSLDLAKGNAPAAVFALLLMVTFFAGAFGASLIIEGASHAYGLALLVEGALLGGFIFVAGISHTTHARALDAEAAILCMAMGMQNSLVTRLSGAVVRTTHVTGVVTDLGIEAALWYRWYRAKLPVVPTLLRSPKPPVRPSPTRIVLLATIIVAFTVGSIGGAVATFRWQQWAMIVPMAAILLASAFAFYQRTLRSLHESTVREHAAH